MKSSALRRHSSCKRVLFSAFYLRVAYLNEWFANKRLCPIGLTEAAWVDDS